MTVASILRICLYFATIFLILYLLFQEVKQSQILKDWREILRRKKKNHISNRRFLRILAHAWKMERQERKQRKINSKKTEEELLG